jgi:hypothetical protein
MLRRRFDGFRSPGGREWKVFGVWAKVGTDGVLEDGIAMHVAARAVVHAELSATVVPGVLKAAFLSKPVHRRGTASGSIGGAAVKAGPEGLLSQGGSTRGI